ncbi:MAG: hypothetical protein GX145_02435 [Clostridiaceae bacterium]|jgi:oligo-1,6-glucosidase|nr:alpha-amylase family glycosyl hydrolase [Bacillota bacterium]NLN51657.1 hypothetical protein [Clostridiaceae bacterium]
MNQIKNRWSLDSTIGEVLNTKMGYEFLSFIAHYSGKSAEDFNKFYLRGLTLKSHSFIQRITRITFDRILANWIIEKLNHFDTCQNLEIKKDSFDQKWWKESIIYQIFVPSFQDSNHDGVGDINGIIQRFEHLLSLNIHAILLSPIFVTPLDDAGYDVEDYYKINPVFGNEDDLKQLIRLCHENDLKIILTLPINQTSIQHHWLKNTTQPDETGDFYLTHDSPNNWQSFYGDSAWLYHRSNKKYYLHLKSSKQIDLNWESENLRREMIDVMLHWQNFGVDGLFLDSASIIAKNNTYPDGSRTFATLTGFRGIEHYIYQPKLLKWLNQIYLALKQTAPDFLVIADCLRMHQNFATMISGDATNRSDLGLSYNQFENPGERRFHSNYLSLDYLSNTWLKMQKTADNNYWPVIFCEDERHPRIVSRIENNNDYRNQIAKLISVLQLTAKGTALLYQGQELGQVNAPFHSMNQIRDIESQLRYEKLIENPDSAEENTKSLDRIIRGSRDHARVPIAWDNNLLNGDFSKNSSTWIDCFVDPGMSVSEQANDSHSVLNFYRALTSLRSHYKTLVYGELIIVSKPGNSILRYFRYDADHAFYVEANLSDEQLNVIGINTAKLARLCEERNIYLPENIDRTVLISNYPDRSQQEFIKNSALYPYEAFIVKLY